MNWPDFATELAKDAVEKNGEAQDAIKAFRERLRKHKEFPSIVDHLFDVATAELVYQIRHDINTATKKANGYYGKPATVVVGHSKEVQSIYKRFYFDGQFLGDIAGERLGKLAEKEAAQANGHSLNAALLRRLVPLVPEGKTVRQCVSEKRLRGILNSVKRSTRKAGELLSGTDNGSARTLNGHSANGNGKSKSPKNLVKPNAEMATAK